MYCTKCGQKLTSNDVYCSNCGTKNIENNLPNNQVQETKNDTLAIILSIISVATFYFPIISIPFGIAGIINGKKYYKETNKKSNAITISVISIILSIFYVILIVGTFLLMIFYSDNKSNINNKIYEDYIEEKYEDWYKDSENEDIKIEIAGHKWQGKDSSVLHLKENKTYNWYLDKYNSDDNFHGGKYEFYTGYEAIKYIALNLPEYNLTEEEQLEWFKSKNYNINDYIVIILNCEYSKIDGKDKTDMNGKIAYYGFYYEENKSMSLINMETNNSAEFTLVDEEKDYKNSNII